MGYSGLALHVHVPLLEPAPPECASEDSPLRAGMKSLGFAEVPLEEQAADRDWMLVGSPPWFTLVDSSGIPVATAAKAELAAALSRAAQAPVLMTVVQDSDEFAVLAFGDGELLDAYATSDSLIGFPFTSGTHSQRARIMRRLFQLKLDGTGWRTLLETSRVFTESVVADLGGRLGIPRQQLLLAGSDAALSAGPGLAVAFRHASAGTGVCDQDAPDRPVDLGEDPGEPPAARRIPLLPREHAYVGFSVVGPAGSFADPVMECSGTAIEGGVVEVQMVPTMWRCGARSVSLVNHPGVRNDHTVARRGHAGTETIWKGLSAVAFQFPPHAPSTLSGMIAFQGVRPGAGSLVCRCFPADGADSHLIIEPSFAVATIEPRWIPDASSASEASRQEGIRRLNDPRVLAAVAIMVDRSVDSLHGIPDEFARWLTHFGTSAALELRYSYEGQMVGTGFRVPKKKGTMSLAELTGKKWRKLWERPAAMQSLFIELALTGASHANSGITAGAVFQRPVVDPSVDGPGALHVAVWRVNKERPGIASVAASSNAMTGLVDHWAASNRLLQAWMAAWDWIPRFSTADENHYTPYEQARGLDSPAAEQARAGGSYMRAAWCDQYLRGVAARMWLSSALLRIEGVEATAPARITPLPAGAARVELDDERRLAELERWLGPCLADPRP